MKKWLRQLAIFLLALCILALPVTGNVQAAKKNQSLQVSSLTKTVGCKPFTLKVTRKGKAKLSFASSNKNVAKISSSGKITVKKVGKTTITVKAAATKTYKAASKKITLTVVPKATTISSVTSPDTGQLKVKWKKQSGVTGYQIRYATTQKMTSAKKVTVTSQKTTSKTIKKLTANKTYWVQIRTYKTSGKTKYYSAWSKAVKKKTKQSKKQVAKAWKAPSYKATADSTYIQDFAQYCDDRLTYGDGSYSGNYYVRTFNGSAEDYAVVKDYVKLVSGGTMNLKLKDTYEQSYSSTFFSMALDYTGSRDLGAETTMAYKTEVKCNVMIYGTIERNTLKVYIYLPSAMDVVDMGYRYGTGKVDVSPAGPSAKVGLYLLSDGRYQTADGRLTAAVGKAVVLRDGEKKTVDASYSTEKKTKEQFCIPDYYRDETIYFNSPYNSLVSGDVFTQRELERKGSSALDSLMSESYAKSLGGNALSLLHGSRWVTPIYGKDSAFKSATVRVMYLDPGKVAVIYIYMSFYSAPYEVESLCAVSLAETEEEDNDTIKMKKGESKKIAYDGQEFVPNYELYEWEVLEGSSLVSLSGTKSAECTVTAKAAGTVRLQVTYEYGKDEPDILTGIMRNVNHVKKKEYVIKIS